MKVLSQQIEIYDTPQVSKLTRPSDFGLPNLVAKYATYHISVL